MQWNDEQVHAYALGGYSKDDIGPDGEVYSRYNPQSHWDAWTLGGRYSRRWTPATGAVPHQAPDGQPEHATRTTEATATWEAFYRKQISLPADTWLANIDCHV